MKVGILQENLAKALGSVSQIAPSKGQLPILSHILLSATEGKLKLTATDLQTSINLWLPAKISKKGKVAVPGKIFTEFISSSPAGKIVLQKKGKGVEVLGKKIKSSFNVLPTKEFPEVPTLEKGEKTVKLKGKKMKDSLALVVFAASTDETRPVLTGVYFLFEEGRLKMVATDGFRLSYRQIKLERAQKKKEMIIPSGSLSEILRLIDEEKDLVFFWDKKENQVIFRQKEVEVASRLIQGEFPAFEKIIPQDFVCQAVLEKQEFFQAIRMAAIFARGSTSTVKLKFEKGLLRISAEDPQVGKHEEEIETEIKGEGITIAFNFRFLMDFLNSTKAEKFLMKVSGSETATIFQPTRGTSFFHLIMPIRLREETS